MAPAVPPRAIIRDQLDIPCRLSSLSLYMEVMPRKATMQVLHSTILASSLHMEEEIPLDLQLVPLRSPKATAAVGMDITNLLLSKIHTLLRLPAMATVRLLGILFHRVTHQHLDPTAVPLRFKLPLRERIFLLDRHPQRSRHPSNPITLQVWQWELGGL